VPGHPFEQGFDLTLKSERLLQPFQWRRPRRIFVNSMSDLFHREIRTTFIDRVFETMEKADWHTYQVLTKRSSLLVRYLRQRYGTAKAPAHIWLGVSVEDAQNTVRLKHLKAAQASIKFVSFEPLLASVGKVDLTGIDWAIVGGESGPKARPMDEEWALEIRDQCLRDGVAFFFKQWGGAHSKAGGRLLKGREWSQYSSGHANRGVIHGRTRGSLSRSSADTGQALHPETLSTGASVQGPKFLGYCLCRRIFWALAVGNARFLGHIVHDRHQCAERRTAAY
jgi:protein gp37